MFAVLPFLAALVVGISDPTIPDYDPQWDHRYSEAVRQGGHAAVLIHFDTDTNRLEEVMSHIDILLMTGGADFEPWRYGAKPSPKLGKPIPARDTFDFTLMELARRRRIPIVGICRGEQALNIFFGGTLWQDLPSEYPGCRPDVVHARGSRSHKIEILPGTRLADVLGAGEHLVNSSHHQAVKDLAPGFRVAARAPDGVVECIEGVDYPAIGVQFHPELLSVPEGAKAFNHPTNMEFVAFFRELPRLVENRAACALKVLDKPAGTSCRTWMKDGAVFLDIANRTGGTVSGTVELNEIFEKAINVSNRLPAEIDGRWIEIELPPGKAMTLRLGK